MIINSVNYSSGGGELDYIPITTYAELISAFATTNTKPLRLMNDLTATAEITTTSTNTLDLHGHTITGNNTFRFMTINRSGNVGNVTLCDLAVGGGGTITTFGGVEYGGCVYNHRATFNMVGGTITNCTASDSGGGVAIESDGSRFNISGNAVISNCTAPYGGGFYGGITGIVNMSGNAIITNCNATKGGGVYAYTESDLNITGGSIINCTASDSGGGLLINNSDTWSEFKFGGTAIIQNNTVSGAANNVYKQKGIARLISNFTGNIGISYPTPSAGGTIGSATTGVTGAENIHADSTRTLIGAVSGTTLKWQTAT